jgi:hypothetical protein
MAEWAAGVCYDDLPPEVVAEAKRYLMDSVACALGGAQQHDVQLASAVLSEIAGPGSATVLVTGQKVDPVSAALLNALMIRVMDYNDIYWKQDPTHPSDLIPAAVMDYNDIYWKQDPTHPSDLIPAAMAAAERSSGSGRDLILGIALGYEFEQRLAEVSFPGIREIGWHHATLTAVASPIVAGRLPGLDADAIQHAIGISASRHCTPGSVTPGIRSPMPRSQASSPLWPKPSLPQPMSNGCGPRSTKPKPMTTPGSSWDNSLYKKRIHNSGLRFVDPGFGFTSSIRRAFPESGICETESALREKHGPNNHGDGGAVARCRPA